MKVSHQHNIGPNNSDTKKDKSYKGIKSHSMVIWAGRFMIGNRDDGGFWGTDNDFDLSEKTFATLEKCNQSNTF